MSGAARTAPARIVLAVLSGFSCAALVFGVAACGPRTADSVGPGEAGAVADPVEPAPWDLATPEAAVRSYLEWVSFSYRMANSEIPTATMTPAELVRIDAYIQLNRTEGKGLEQTLESIETSVASEDATNAVVTAREAWSYRYFSLESLEYLTDIVRESYEATYTLVREPAGWLVDRVEASALTAE